MKTDTIEKLFRFNNLENLLDIKLSKRQKKVLMSNCNISSYYRDYKDVDDINTDNRFHKYSLSREDLELVSFINATEDNLQSGFKIDSKSNYNHNFVPKPARRDFESIKLYIKSLRGFIERNYSDLYDTALMFESLSRGDERVISSHLHVDYYLYVTPKRNH